MSDEVKEPERPKIEIVYEGLVNRKVDKWLIPLIITFSGLALITPLILTIVGVYK